jgi:hypothetical protein
MVSDFRHLLNDSRIQIPGAKNPSDLTDLDSIILLLNAD